MSPEALARLRKDLADQVAPSRDDLRALLDAYDEAVSLLAALRKRATTHAQGRWVDGAFHQQLSDADVRAAKAETDAADAVLAKAGRRGAVALLGGSPMNAIDRARAMLATFSHAEAWRNAQALAKALKEGT